MEGRWNGEATVYTPGKAPEVRVVAVELVFDDAAGRWNERQSLTTSTGLTSTQVGSPDVMPCDRARGLCRACCLRRPVGG
jgi:hypothetical protein